MSHQRTVYVIDQDLADRRFLTAHLARLGVEAWPFASTAEFFAIIDHLVPACILLDVGVDETGALDVLGTLAAREAAWPVVVTGGAIDLRLAVHAMKLGAVDVLAKPIEFEGLASALIQGWDRLQEAIATSASLRAAQDQVARLTPRETDIALALLAGKANKGVAHALGISVRTVEMHRAHIMTKLGVRSLAEAAVIATQAGLIPCVRPAPARPLLRSVPPPAAAERLDRRGMLHSAL